MVVDPSSYYTIRDTVIIVPLDGTDLSKIDLEDLKVFEDSVDEKYLHWIKWDVSFPVVQISKTILNENDQNMDEALKLLKDEVKLVIDEAGYRGETSDILMSKNDNILSVASDGWEVIETIDFMKAREKKIDTEDYDADNNSDDEIKATNMNHQLFPPIRIVGMIMMIFFFAVIAHFIKVGKKRNGKVWEAEKARSINGDLVSYEGTNFLLQNSQINGQSLQQMMSPPPQDSLSLLSKSRQYARTKTNYHEEAARVISTDKASPDHVRIVIAKKERLPLGRKISAPTN